MGYRRLLSRIFVQRELHLIRVYNQRERQNGVTQYICYYVRGNRNSETARLFIGTSASEREREKGARERSSPGSHASLWSVYIRRELRVGTNSHPIHG